MRENQGFILTCCLLGADALFQLEEGQYGDSIGGAIPVLLGTVLAAILGFIALFRVLRRHDLPLSERLIPLYFWLGPVALAAVFNTWLNRVDYAANFMCVSTSSDSIMAGYDFKDDGRYKYWEGSPFGIAYNYGRYVRRDSIITLLPASTRNAPQEIRLIIRPYSSVSHPAFNQKSVLYAMNKEGAIINSSNGYYIKEMSAK
ncbi:hypothetical protein IC235_09470 [Hymenobacter sp. BT664]|uniref:Uncharacterized protein n=1 Tax=Hymenobacter montanus TaxID=2771359 RepID=A0A927BDR8_9BACT|nr:hypothetical protein [Hymenobacter montanus]MBD2768118.1 hypothetical protein [Hymenobacter montanus]